MSDHALLDSNTHRALRIRTEAAAALGDALMCCITVPLEFRQVQATYPILFRRDAEGSFVALAMFGFENGENLFLEGDRWDAPHRPLAMATRPFLIGPPRVAGGDPQVHVDLGSPRIDTGGEGVRLFDDHGQPTPYLERIASQLGTLHQGAQDAAAFFAALERHELLEPMTLDVTLDDGSQHRLVGFHAIAEERLMALDADAVADLHAQGHLMPVFMALASLSHLGDLIARKNRRLRDG